MTQPGVLDIKKSVSQGLEIAGVHPRLHFSQRGWQILKLHTRLDAHHFHLARQWVQTDP